MEDSIKTLEKEIAEFSKERDWDKFHTPANLAKSISIESGELLECFQWNDDDFNIDNVKEELADVLNYSIQLAISLNLDIKTIIEEKMKKNAAKYPVAKCKGKADKYTSYK